MTDSLTGVGHYEVERNGVRLDKFVAEASGCGRREARALIRSGCVRIDGHHGAAATLLRLGQRIEVVEPPRSSQVDYAPGDLEPRIICEGDDWLAISKPAGLHSVAGASEHSVADWLRRTFPGAATAGEVERDGGLVNRLDRDTSGVLLAARDRAGWRRLRDTFSRHLVEKHYLALVGKVLERAVVVEQPLARRKSRVRVPRRGERSYPARTSFHPLETGDEWSLVLATMRTGVTHQIRAHAALAGMPILGDLKYGERGGPPEGRDGHLLHALRIAIPDTLDVTAPVDDDFTRALGILRGE